MTTRPTLFQFLTGWILLFFLHLSLFQPLYAEPSWRKPLNQETKEKSRSSGSIDEVGEAPEQKELDPLSPPPSIERKAFSPQSFNLQRTDLARSQGMTQKQSSFPMAAVLEVYSNSVPPAELAEIANILRREVKNTGRYLVFSRTEMRKALSKNLDQEITAARKIDEYVAQARRLYDEFKFDSAGAIMKEAMTAISAFDATPPVAQKISEAYLTQGLILEAQGKEKESNVAFLNAAALSPDRQLDPSLYAPGVIAKFYKAKTDYLKIKEGALRIETNPPVAKIIIGGKDRGTTPATLKNLPLGIQKIVLLKDGFDPWEKNIMVVATSPNDYMSKINIDLSRKGENVSLDPLLGEVVNLKDYDLQINKLADIGKLLFVDQVFTARIEKGEKVYNLFLTQIDVHTGREVGRGYAPVDPNLADVDVSIRRALAHISSGQPPRQWVDRIAVEGKGGNYIASFKKKRPFYKKWPFYMVMGLVLAGGGAGTALILNRTSPGTGNLGGAPQP